MAIHKDTEVRRMPGESYVSLGMLETVIKEARQRGAKSIDGVVVGKIDAEGLFVSSHRVVSVGHSTADSTGISVGALLIIVQPIVHKG